uniref:Uncharacterized protein n=1 Tax=Anopheles farauti TaxID=69004 RepID=A0A182QMY0_9DIPT
MSTVHLRVMGMANLLHDGFETAVLVRLVLDDTLRTVGFMQRVLSLDDIAITHFPLALVVSGVRVLHSILELVLRVRVVVLVLLMVQTVSTETVLSSVVLSGSNHGQAGNDSDDLTIYTSQTSVNSTCPWCVPTLAAHGEALHGGAGAQNQKQAPEMYVQA